MGTNQINKMSDIIKYFKYEHLPDHLQPTSKAFADLARTIEANHMPSAEKSVVLRKLLEAKDAAVRSRLYTNEYGTCLISSADSSQLI